jgi:hypothetical protein
VIADEDGIQVDPRSILLKLQDKLKPRKWESDLKVRNDWQSLQRGWNRKISLDDWLNQWTIIYRQARKLNLYDFPDERVFADFLFTIKSIDPHFANRIDVARDLGKEEPFESVVNRFREMRRRESEHPAHRKQIEAYPSFRGQDQGVAPGASRGAAPAKTCICGSPRHITSNCWAINEDERPEGWKVKPEKQKRVNEAID